MRVIWLVVAAMALGHAPHDLRERQGPHVAATIERVLPAAADSAYTLRVAITVEPGWHIGAPRPGVVGVPTRLAWHPPAGWLLMGERWPTPRQEVTGRDTAFTYSGSILVEAALVRQQGARDPIIAVLSYVVCRDICIPGQLTLTYAR